MGIFSSKPDYSKIRTKRNKEAEANKPARPWLKWVKFAVVCGLYLLFLYWVKSWWGLIVVPFIFDAYITKFINWGWWKELENPGRTIMSWIDAIVFALIAVYFVHNFFFQNYRIPSSSLEKTLLTGDYLLVSKLSYGPRIPQTPLTMPLTQHTLPIFNCKSYIEWPQWDYRRVKGLGKVELGDIVVFNYPAGDTTTVRYNNDFYILALEMGYLSENPQDRELPPLSELYDGLSTEEQMQRFQHYYQKGKAIIKQQEETYGEVVVRPTDRKENYVKRCVGLPGQTLEIRNKVIYTDGQPQAQPELSQFNYRVKMKGDYFLSSTAFDEVCAELGISDEDRDNQANPVAGMPLTQKAKAALEAMTNAVDTIEEVIDGNFGPLYPLDHDYGWTRDNYGPILIPKKGQTIPLTLDNIAIYERPIRTYEKNDLDIRGGKILINGEEATEYTFKMDYYWMMGDNRHYSLDSRYWGFVPEDHIVGKPLFVWISVSPDQNPKTSHWRWGRIFKWVSGIK